jgi:RimJ/RimL family protein N-acetyltransferase
LSEMPIVCELDDDDQILELLSTQRPWSAYALCDLDPPHREFARYIGALRGGSLTAAVLVYSPPTFTSLQPFGDPADVSAIMSQAGHLPERPLLIAQTRSIAAVDSRYRLDRMWKMHRMAVTAAHFIPAPPVSAEVVRLTADELSAVQDFYSGWPDTVFAPSMLASGGVYFGAVRGDQLVAVAGTHAVSTRHHMGVIGNVYTRPEHRGQGLATAVTGAVVEAMFDAGIHDVALSVLEDNEPARRAYSRLGFRLTEPFWEAEITRR